jgi:hypothetical protein
MLLTQGAWQLLETGFPLRPLLVHHRGFPCCPLGLTLLVGSTEPLVGCRAKDHAPSAHRLPQRVPVRDRGPGERPQPVHQQGPLGLAGRPRRLVIQQQLHQRLDRRDPHELALIPQSLIHQPHQPLHPCPVVCSQLRPRVLDRGRGHGSARPPVRRPGPGRTRRRPRVNHAIDHERALMPIGAGKAVAAVLAPDLHTGVFGVLMLLAARGVGRGWCGSR